MTVYLAMCGCQEAEVLGAYDNMGAACEHSQASPCKRDSDRKRWEVDHYEVKSTFTPEKEP